MRRLPLDARMSTLTRRALVGTLTLYGIACLTAPERFRIPDALNLAVHETGHLVFLPLGEFMHFLGGTLFQLIFPLLFVAHFFRRGDPFAAYVLCWWFAQSLWNVSVYVADARAQLLPLVGGGEHDWEYILGTLGLLHLDQRISRTFHFAGVLVFAWAMVMAWFEAAAVRAPRKSGDAGMSRAMRTADPGWHPVAVQLSTPAPAREAAPVSPAPTAGSEG